MEPEVSEVSEIFKIEESLPDETKEEEDEEEQKESEKAKETTEEDNYMELYVEKELKDKIEPLQELLEKRKEDIKVLNEKINELDGHIRRVDRHHNGVQKAMLAKQGIILREITELTVLREYRRIAEKEHALRKKMRMQKTSSISPSRRVSVDGSPRSTGSERDSTSKYMTRLAPMAFERKWRKSSPKRVESFGDESQQLTHSKVINVKELLNNDRLDPVAGSLYSHIQHVEEETLLESA